MNKYLDNQKLRYKINNKYDVYLTDNIFNRLNNLTDHFNDWRPNEKEFDNFIKYHIIPSIKYLGQDKQNEYNQLKKNKPNLTNKEIKRYNYLIKLRNYKMNNNLDCVELEKHIKNNIFSL
jgi:hypothetical protein